MQPAFKFVPAIYVKHSHTPPAMDHSYYIMQAPPMAPQVTVSMVATFWYSMTDCGNNCTIKVDGRYNYLYHRGSSDYDKHLFPNSGSCRLSNHPWYRNDSCIWKQSIFAFGAKKVFVNNACMFELGQLICGCSHLLLSSLRVHLFLGIFKIFRVIWTLTNAWRSVVILWRSKHSGQL
jgi:hypothetical protein